MDKLEVLEITLKYYYLNNNFITNDKEWFRINIDSRYRNKNIKIIDMSGKDETRCFNNFGTLDEMFDTVILSYKEKMMVDNDYEDIERIIYETCEKIR